MATLVGNGLIEIFSCLGMLKFRYFLNSKIFWLTADVGNNLSLLAVAASQKLESQGYASSDTPEPTSQQDEPKKIPNLNTDIILPPPPISKF